MRGQVRTQWTGRKSQAMRVCTRNKVRPPWPAARRHRRQPRPPATGPCRWHRGWAAGGPTSPPTGGIWRPRPAARRSCGGRAAAAAMPGSCHTLLGACNAQQRGMASDSTCFQQNSIPVLTGAWGTGRRVRCAPSRLQEWRRSGAEGRAGWGAGWMCMPSCCCTHKHMHTHLAGSA